MIASNLSKQRRRLKGVTLWSCAHNDVEYLRRTILVLKFCEQHFEFDDVLLLTHLDPVPGAPSHWRVERRMSSTPAEWSRFHIFSVPGKIHTEFALSVHEDGFPIQPELWSEDFLAYDYIGAPWPDGIVGNGGFCLESKKLLDMKVTLQIPRSFIYPSDLLICKLYRPKLMERGIRFAPTDVALRFSTEELGKSKPSFGFHGRIACPEKYKAGWDAIGGMQEQCVAPPSPPAPPPKPAPYLHPTVPILNPARVGALRLAHSKIKQPRLALVYVHVPNDGPHQWWARRFVASYVAYPPGEKHRVVVICNGAKVSPATRRLFAPLPDCEFFEHDDSGWDLGAYVAYAKQSKDDLLVCIGGSGYFKQGRWLARLVEVWRKFGPGMYGTLASYEVRPHLNTTGFMVPPELLRAYPDKLVSKADRYQFEHGRGALCNRVARAGMPVLLVTWDGEYTVEKWRTPPNIFRRGDQSNCLTFWFNSDHYDQQNDGGKKDCAGAADTYFHDNHAHIFAPR